MQHASRFLAVAISAVYGLAAVLLVLVALLPFTSILLQPAVERAAPQSVLVIPAVFLAIAAVLFAAAVGLFKERMWARWPFLVVTLLALILLVQTLPVGAPILSHFHAPPPGAYVVFTKADILSNFERFVLPSVWLFFFTAAAAVFVFQRTR